MPREPAEKLTASRVKHLTTEKRQQDFADHRVPGLTLRVSGATNRKTWLVSYRANGKRRRMKIGTYPATSLAQARSKAIAIQGKVEKGEDPLQSRREKRDGSHSFEVLAREVLRSRARKTRERTIQERQRILEKDLLPQWAGRPVSQISRRDVVLLVEEIAERAPSMANRTLRLIHLIFNDGLRRGFPTLEANPAHLVEPPGEEAGRDRYLSTSEIGAVWRATVEETPTARGAFRLALLTAQRMGSVMSMRWEDLSDRLWTIPAERFKGKRVHLVPLSPQASEVLDELRQIAGSEVWVFPSRQGTKEPFIATWNSMLDRIRRRASIEHWTVHDFRTTFRTHATRAEEDGGLGVRAHAADAVLGHKEASLGFDRYTGDRGRYLLHEKREALAKWGAFVRRTVEDTE